MWLREHGQTSNGKDVAPRGRARTDYVGEKVTVLIVCSLTNIRADLSCILLLVEIQ